MTSRLQPSGSGTYIAMYGRRVWFGTRVGGGRRVQTEPMPIALGRALALHVAYVRMALITMEECRTRGGHCISSLQAQSASGCTQ